MTRMGICAPKSAMTSKPPDPTRGSRAWAQNSRIFGSSSATRRGVNAREQQPSVDGVRRRVLEDDHAGRDVDVRLDDLEDGALARDVRLRVEETLLDVLVAADSPEVVGVVVIERRFFTQSSIDGIRINVDLDAVHVVVDVVAHDASPGRPRPQKVRVRLRREYLEGQGRPPPPDPYRRGGCSTWYLAGGRLEAATPVAIGWNPGEPELAGSGPSKGLSGAASLGGCSKGGRPVKSKNSSMLLHWRPDRSWRAGSTSSRRTSGGSCGRGRHGRRSRAWRTVRSRRRGTRNPV